MFEKKKDFLTLKDYSRPEIEYIIKLAYKIKKNRTKFKNILKGKSIAMLFDKHSTRTRLSFEVGINQLGGNCIYLDKEKLQIKRGETQEDSARIFSGYLDGLIIRTFSQKTVEVFADFSTIPVINGLTDLYHPCQILSDLFTISEQGLLDKSSRLTYIGDSNNILNSILIGFTKLGLDLTVGCSEKYKPDNNVLDYAKKESQKSGSTLKVTYDPIEAVSDADIIYTDVWISMGDKNSDTKIRELAKFQINKKLISYAKKGVKIMHCLPAHRDQEITSEILDSTSSIVYQQAENRLYAQKALMVFLYS
jgi:ornithine carbamoyltransferase